MTRRFRAPKGHGEILADPPFTAVEALARQNHVELDAASVVMDGCTLREFRKFTRSELIGIQDDTLLFVTGHQPELFHPGVWVKNFAVNGLARRLHGVPVNLVVDSDTIKSAAILSPRWDTDPRKVRLEKVPFDEFRGEIPWELTKWANEFSTRRLETERRWGCENREITVSMLSRSTAFQRFVKHLSAHHVAFRDSYNRAVAQYRSTHKIRSKSHPVPDLTENELPFWEMPPHGGPHTHRTRATLATPRERLRPRALTLTLFVRLCLADWFIHGIGGGKYDEVTDTIIRDFFGIEPPGYQVVSGTLHLPLPGFPYSQSDVSSLEEQLRQLRWNPETVLAPNHPTRIEKAKLTQTKPNSRAEIRDWFARIRALTAKMRAEVIPQITAIEQRLNAARAQVAANAILQRRDFSWVHFPEDVLRPFLQQFLEV